MIPILAGVVLGGLFDGRHLSCSLKGTKKVASPREVRSQEMGRAARSGPELCSFRDLKGDMGVCRESERERRQMVLGGQGRGQGLQGLRGALFTLVSADLETMKQGRGRLQLLPGKAILVAGVEDDKRGTSMLSADKRG